MDNHHHRSFFWPIVLIGVGVIWLLHNLGMIPTINIGALLKLWPLLLVVIGLNILFGRRAPWIGGLIGLLAVGTLIAFLFFGSSLGIDTSPTVKTESLSAPIEGATSVLYKFDTSSAPVTIDALSDSTDLMDAVISHRGDLNFDVSGTTDKTVRLSESTTASGWFIWDLSINQLGWDISLSPEVPTKMEVDGGSGSLNIDLSKVQLTSFKSAFGSGSSSINLPITSAGYPVEISSGSGSVNLTLPIDTDIQLSLDSGSGSVHVTLPDNYALQIGIYDEGSGSLNLPAGLVRSESTSATYGTWQTEGFDQAAHKIIIKILSRGSGSISIN